MIKRLILLVAATFLLTSLAPAFGQSEDEVVAQYIKKTEKKQKERRSKVGFLALYGSYGKLSDDNSYNKFTSYTNSSITNVSAPGALSGIYRSKQFGGNFGFMASSKMAIKLGFEYWLKMGSDETGDYNLAVEPLGLQSDFNLLSKIQVYGFTAGLDYYILNHPDRAGIINSLALHFGAGAGYYMAKWEIWQGSSSFNLATGESDANAEPLKGSTPGFTASLGADYPIRFFDLVLGAEVSYLYLNFTNVHSYNDVGEELYLTCSANTNDRVDLDFSGPRVQMQLKKFFHW
jgi:hypothetical protein